MYNEELSLAAAAPSIRWLSLKSFTNKSITSAAAAFPLLDFLSLEGMQNLEEIWEDDALIPSNSFNNLKKLRLVRMWRLKRMGKSAVSTAKDFFSRLETIYIGGCGEMEHLVTVRDEEEEEQEKEIHVLRFPELKTLRLGLSEKLRSMIGSRGIGSIQFPLLAEIHIDCCGNLKWLDSRDDDDDDHYRMDADGDDASSHLFCRPKVSFGNVQKLTLGASATESKDVWCDRVPMGFFTGLVELNISGYKKIRSLFSSSSNIPQNLVNLQILHIYYCIEMVRVIGDEGELPASSLSSCDDRDHDRTTKHTTATTTTLLFPSLQHLTLSHLYKLESFCKLGHALELASLKILEIVDCHEMKSFNAAAGSVIVAPELQTLLIN